MSLKSLGRTLGIGVAAAALALVGLPAVAAETGSTSSSDASGRTDVASSLLSQFRANLATAAAKGDTDAAASLARFDTLTEGQLAELAGYLAGDFGTAPLIDPAANTTPTTSGTQVVASRGDATWVVQTGSSPRKSLGLPTVPRGASINATTYNVHSYADESFVFAGVTVSKTRVWADYVTGSGVVKSISDYGCQLVQNYEPTAQISTSKQSSSLSGGQATFKCYVVVSRGTPTPWGQVTWSTRSAYQYMKVAGPGVVAHGWM